ncbi:TPA: hypothetical protein QCI16_004347 [Enterobacter ludwigii]|nr:hypothetical protein [Enterobacter ludwigii]HDR2600135.1 hypothetical protein [Enterobacter ludwigii]
MEIHEIIKIFNEWGFEARESDNTILVFYGEVAVRLSLDLLNLNSTEFNFLALQVGDLVKSSPA